MGPQSESTAERERLILALLQTTTLEKAAAAAGMSISTAYRIKRTPEFQQEFREARSQAFGDAMSRLQSAAGMAVATLIALLSNGAIPASVRLRAADILLDRAGDARLEELEARIQRVEALSEARRARGRNRNPA